VRADPHDRRPRLPVHRRDPHFVGQPGRALSDLSALRWNQLAYAAKPSAPLLQTARCDLLDGSGKDIYPTFSGFWMVKVIFCLTEALPQRVVRTLAVMALILLIELHGLVAQAGVYTDDLSKCLVKSSNDADRLVLVQWIFSGLSLHPAVQPLVSITTEQREAFNDKVAALLSRLLVDDCRKEAIDALKYEGSAALDASFQVLAQIASRDLMAEPHVVKGLNGLVTYLANDEKLISLLDAAGIPEPKPSTETPAK
jgi:hypothetical protein